MRIKRNHKNLLNRLQSSNIWGNKIVKKKFYNNLNRFFLIGQKIGFHIVPNHYYYPIPDTRFLTKKMFLHKTKHIGLNMYENEQLKLLLTFISNYKDEFNSFPREKTETPYQYFTTNGNFKSVDGEILYCMIRHFKPARIVEIGSGYSSYCSVQAIRQNKKSDEKYKCEFIAIEPTELSTIL